MQELKRFRIGKWAPVEVKYWKTDNWYSRSTKDIRPYFFNHLLSNETTFLFDWLWASCQMRKITGCACAGNAGNVFPATAGLRSRHAPRHVRHARTSGFLWSRWRGKRFRHSRRMRNLYFSYLVRSPWTGFIAWTMAPYVIVYLCFQLIDNSLVYVHVLNHEVTVRIIKTHSVNHALNQ